jgi:hypothetical protein
MMKKIVIIGIAIVIIAALGYGVIRQKKRVAGATTPVAAEVTMPGATRAQNPPETIDEAQITSAGMVAIKKASEANQHCFIFFHDGNSEQTVEARRAFEAAVGKLGDGVQWTFVDRNDASEKYLIQKYQLKAAPMPLILVRAPNGAITGGFLSEKLKDLELREALATPCEQRCLKAMQDRKLVFLCIQNDVTKSNDAAMQGVNDFKADGRFTQFTEIVKMDPASAKEQSFLSKLKIDPKINEAATFFLAPPGVMVSRVAGATVKNDLLAALMKVSSSGCGTSGCGPKGCEPK